MVMLPPGIKESYGVMCPSCGYKKIVHGEPLPEYKPIRALFKKLFPARCPKCDNKLVKDCSIRIQH